MIIWNIAQDNSVSSICINSKYETAELGVFWRLPDMEYFENDLSGRLQRDMLWFAYNYSSVERL